MKVKVIKESDVKSKLEVNEDIDSSRESLDWDNIGKAIAKAKGKDFESVEKLGNEFGVVLSDPDTGEFDEIILSHDDFFSYAPFTNKAISKDEVKEAEDILEVANLTTGIVNGYCQMLRISREELMTISIPNSVTKIGDYTFSGCKKLTSITVPDSVTSIGGGAFQHCDNLTIKCNKGSYAERYAKENDIPVEYLNESITRKKRSNHMKVKTISEDIDNTSIDEVEEFIAEVKERFPEAEVEYDGDTHAIRILLP